MLQWLFSRTGKDSTGIWLNVSVIAVFLAPLCQYPYMYLLTCHLGIIY
jgi:hypothetical protein